MDNAQLVADQIGEAMKWGMAFAVLTGVIAGGIVRLLADLYYEIRASRRHSRLRRFKLLKAAKEHASGRADLGTATGFDPWFLDAINQLDMRRRIDAHRAQWEAQQASAGR